VNKGQISRTYATYEDIIRLIPFFYAFESPLFYNHHNRDGDVIIIPSIMGTHQGNLLRGALFSLIHLRALYSTISHFLSYLFPSITDDIHIIGPLPLYPLHMNIFKLNFMR